MTSPASSEHHSTAATASLERLLVAYEAELEKLGRDCPLVAEVEKLRAVTANVLATPGGVEALLATLEGRAA